MINYILVTQSEGKLNEFEKIMKKKVETAHIDLPEIQSIDVEDVVNLKLLEAFKIIQKPVMVEDTGLYIRSWKKFPGALIKWMIESVGIAGICKMLNNFESRSAYAKTVIGLYDGKNKPKYFTGIVYGEIAFEPRGPGGFGWDKIFIPKGEIKTFGEMDINEKNKYSMRKKAIEKMIKYLNEI